LLWCGIITLFPETLTVLESGITGRAIKSNLLTINTWNPRDYAFDKHRTVDDSPYGGGPGMILMAEPLRAAIQAAKNAAPTPPTVIYLSPQGKRFDQAAAATLATKQSIIFIAGRYEGIDERIIEQEVDEEWSIGDYVLSGGELAAMVMIDAATRLIPGAVGKEESISTDSWTSGLLKYPQYTRPEQSGDLAVPSVLLSGNHQAIERWRHQQSLGRTWQKRPDLLENRTLTAEEQRLLAEFIKMQEV
jgi:tRNA (guanine37-N1)-methyltransferase